jgi:membrane-associated phospholipid phosphatase
VELAKLVSYALHPLTVTFFGFLAFVLATGLPYLSAVIAGAFFSLIPFLITLYFKRRGLAKSVLLEGREERVRPIALSLFSYAFGTALSWALGYSALVPVELGYIGSTVVILLLTLKYKVSVHVSVVTGFASVLTLFASPAFLLAFLLVPLVAWARLKLGAHTLGQVAAGALIGGVLSPTLVLAFRAVPA